MKAVDLFSGCGGLSLGLEFAGINVVCAYDNWPEAAAVYSANFSHPCKAVDLSDNSAITSELSDMSLNLIAGGPPCQDFSHAGKRTENQQAPLTVKFAQIATELRPTWIVMENVARARHSAAYKHARKLLKASGYGLTEVVLNASLCGVPQRRSRFFCIARAEVDDGFLEPTIEANKSDREMTVRDYLGEELGVDDYYRHPRNYNRRGIFSVDEPAPTVRGVNRPIPKGYTGHHNDTVPLSQSVRPLTTLERARLQTFPVNFKFFGTKTALEQMIGNAVPVELGRFVGRSILEYETGKGSPRSIVATPSGREIEREI